MVRDAVVEVRDAESGTVLHPLEHEKRVLCLAQQLVSHLLLLPRLPSPFPTWSPFQGLGFCPRMSGILQVEL